MKQIELCFLIIITLVAFSCVPESKKILTEVEISPSDPEVIRIAAHQYNELTDSILPYFSHANPTYRYIAARAFASHQDERSLDSLYTLLDDPVLKVRSVAAYAIGQIRNENSTGKLLEGFRQRDTMSLDNSGNSEILHAIGKIGDEKLRDYMLKADGYRKTDTLLLLGRMKGLYNYALRGMISPEIVTLAVETVRDKSIDNSVRLVAAHCLSRPTAIDIDKYKFQIAEAMIEESDVYIKMALVSALRHTDDREIQNTLLDQLDLALDYRIKCNLIRTLQSYSYIESAEKIIELLKNKNTHVAIAAANYLAENGSKDDVSFYRTIARDTTDWRVNTVIYKSIFKLLPYYYTKTINATRWQVQQAIKSEADTLAITQYIEALGNDPGSYPYLIEYGKDKTNVPIKTAITSALTNMLSSENFAGTHQGFVRFHRRKIFDYLKEEMMSGDEGITGLVADAIAKSATELVSLIDSTEFLFEAKDRLQFPGQIESINAVEKAIAAVRGVNNPKLTVATNTKLPNWSLLEKYDENTNVIVKTNKGVFTISLYMEESIGSVLNFLSLVEGNFYDNKIFHRVVPNFVIQTGSPRGDNYGGMDYVIRSDLGPLEYDDEGYVGMASAGPDTESTQWFVTHSPTPHLDGKYSILGKVTEGMDVVHRIQLGDIIEDIIITSN